MPRTPFFKDFDDFKLNYNHLGVTFSIGDITVETLTQNQFARAVETVLNKDDYELEFGTVNIKASPKAYVKISVNGKVVAQVAHRAQQRNTKWLDMWRGLLAAYKDLNNRIENLMTPRDVIFQSNGSKHEVYLVIRESENVQVASGSARQVAEQMRGWLENFDAWTRKTRYPSYTVMYKPWLGRVGDIDNPWVFPVASGEQQYINHVKFCLETNLKKFEQEHLKPTLEEKLLSGLKVDADSPEVVNLFTSQPGSGAVGDKPQPTYPPVSLTAPQSLVGVPDMRHMPVLKKIGFSDRLGAEPKPQGLVAPPYALVKATSPGSIIAPGTNMASTDQLWEQAKKEQRWVVESMRLQVRNLDKWNPITDLNRQSTLTAELAIEFKDHMAVRSVPLTTEQLMKLQTASTHYLKTGSAQSVTLGFGISKITLLISDTMCIQDDNTNVTVPKQIRRPLALYLAKTAANILEASESKTMPSVNQHLAPTASGHNNAIETVIVGAAVLEDGYLVVREASAHKPRLYYIKPPTGLRAADLAYGHNAEPGSKRFNELRKHGIHPSPHPYGYQMVFEQQAEDGVLHALRLVIPDALIQSWLNINWYIFTKVYVWIGGVEDIDNVNYTADINDAHKQGWVTYKSEDGNRVNSVRVDHNFNALCGTLVLTGAPEVIGKLRQQVRLSLIKHILTN